MANSGKIPHLAVTLGDPAGIGPEIILKALADTAITANCKVTVIGSSQVLNDTFKQLGGEKLANPATLSILDLPLEGKITVGRGNEASGGASFGYLKKAIALTLKGQFQGIVTAPIAKSLWKKAGYDYPGQTEVLAQDCGVEKYGMLFVGRSPYTGWTLRTLLATTHIPLAQVPTALNPELMTVKLDLLVECLKRDFGIKQPKIWIAGLNPHSGEQGQLGREEQDWLNSWLETEQKKRPEINIIGPIPPDTMWVKPGQAWYGSILTPPNPSKPPLTKGGSVQENPADGFIALYHDQGLIPVKLMAFEQAINTTIGLPFIRTSPDHGTAFDIAGKGIANANSMKQAIKLAAELTQQRLTIENC